MKFIFLILFHILCASIAEAQSNHVFSGGEMLNFGTIDISSFEKIAWSSEKDRLPGYFGVINNGKFIGYSDQANINGYIKKYGNTAFLFPVGNGKDLRTLEISAPQHTTDAYAVAWLEGDPSHFNDHTNPVAGEHPISAFAEPLIGVSNYGQWDWQVGASGTLGEDATGNGENLTITVSIPDMKSFAEASTLRLVGWNGTQWIDLSKSATANGNTEDSQLSGTMIAGITAIGIGKVAISSYTIDDGNFLLFPNPVRNYDNLFARFKSDNNGMADIIVFDAIGKQVLRRSIQYKSGVNTIPIDVKILANGNYYLNIISNNGVIIARGKKFIKQ